MNLPIKIFSCFLVLVSYQVSFSQESDYKFPQDDHYIIFKIAYAQPIGLGDNFVNKSFKNSTGLDFEVDFNVLDSNFLLGLRYATTYNQIKNNERVGGQIKTNSSFIGPLVGYQFLPRNDLRYSLIAGVGSITYKNFFKDNFNDLTSKDSGYTFWITPEVDYHFNKHFGVYFSTTFQKDYLDIEAPKQVEDYFKSPNYIKLQLGVKVLL